MSSAGGTTRAIRERIERHLRSLGHFIQTDIASGERVFWLGGTMVSITAIARAAQDPEAAARRTQGRKRRL